MDAETLELARRAVASPWWTTCSYPRPAAFPATREVVLDHCYPKGGRKCWWYENGTCFAEEPENHRNPHVPGRYRLRGILEDPKPEELIDADILRKCDEHSWRRAVKTDSCAACAAHCGGPLPGVCLAADVVDLKVEDEADV